MICQVCSASEAEYHFGGISCRACAAFFRRFHFSTKKYIFCTCKKQKQSSHPCRPCRLKKCLAIGMDEKKIQGKRDTCNSNSRLSIPPPLSLINCQIISRNSPHMSSTVTHWPSFEKKRNELYGMNFHDMNIYLQTSYIKPSTELLWALMNKVFPQTDVLGDSDKNAMLSNFIPKWWQFEPAIDFEENEKAWKAEGKTVDNAIFNFYSADTDRISKQEAVRIFGPFWDFYYNSVIVPIANRKFDKAEYMALILLLFFDNAYTNISEDCGRMCEAIRKVILRELRGYQKDKNSDEMRFLDTVETLLIIDKGERKFEEEMMICDMHNVRIHEDFREMIQGCGY